MHLRPFVDLIRGAEPAAPEEQYAGSGYDSQSRAASDASIAAATTHSGVPAQALPASAGGYQAAGGSDYGSAQPYASSDSATYYSGAASSRLSAPEQALMAVRGAESDWGSGQFAVGQHGGRAQEGATEASGSGQAAGSHVNDQSQIGAHQSGIYGQAASSGPAQVKRRRWTAAWRA